MLSKWYINCITTTLTDMTHLKPAEAAELLGITVRSLERWRTANIGPAYVTIGKKVSYPRAALIDWLAEHVTIPDGTPPTPPTPVDRQTVELLRGKTYPYPLPETTEGTA